MNNYNLPPTYLNNNDTVLRAALYIRVSTAEQAMHGYSIEAQKEYLTAYAKEHKMRIVGVYADEGKSASKLLYKRKELLRMIDDMEAGKIDVILFKDITRWSRNTSHYHKIQDRIDAAGGYWVAVQQPYLETKTPTGRFQVTVMLGNAQLEAEQTSERIKFVNASRIPKGGVPYGARSCPFGYTVEEVDGVKRMVKDKTEEHMVNAFFEHFQATGSLRGSVRFLAETYGFKLQETSARRLMRNTLYKGEFKGVQGYCEPYITPEQFDSITRLLEKRSYTSNTNTGNHVYIFSSLARCAECGSTLYVFRSNPRNGKNYIYYRCKNYTMYKRCTHSKGILESKLEKWLLENIEDEMNKYMQAVEVESKPQPDAAKKRKSIERKIKNLRELYIDGDIDKAEYMRRKEEYQTQLAALPEVKQRDTKHIEEFLNSDWRALYEGLEPIEKRVFWRSILESITIDNSQNITPNFF